MKRLLILGIALAVLYSVAEVAAGSYAESRVVKLAAEHLPPGAQVEADVSTPLLLGLVTQRQMRRVKVTAQDIAAGPLRADRITAIASGVSLDVGASLRTGKPVVTSVEYLEGLVKISQEQVSKILPPGLTFEFTPGTVTLKGQGLTLKGRLSLQNERIVFQPASGRLPLTLRVPAINLSNLPLVSCIRELKIMVGHMELTCRINNPPTPDFLG